MKTDPWRICNESESRSHCLRSQRKQRKNLGGNERNLGGANYSALPKEHTSLIPVSSRKRKTLRGIEIRAREISICLAKTEPAAAEFPPNISPKIKMSYGAGGEKQRRPHLWIQGADKKTRFSVFSATRPTLPFFILTRCAFSTENKTQIPRERAVGEFFFCRLAVVAVSEINRVRIFGWKKRQSPGFFFCLYYSLGLSSANR